MAFYAITLNILNGNDPYPNVLTKNYGATGTVHTLINDGYSIATDINGSCIWLKYLTIGM
jgi:hypothetical protein